MPSMQQIWTALQHDAGPDRLGLWHNVLPEQHMVLITSDCVQCISPEQQPALIASDCCAICSMEQHMALITSDCGLTR